MEGVVLLGLLGAGYLMNEEKNKKHTVYPEATPPLFTNTGNTIYDVNNYEDSKKYEKQLVDQYHQAAMTGDSKVIDALNMNGRNTLRDSSRTQGSSNMISSMSGAPLSKENFMTNDQGVTMEPFFSGSPANINFDENINLIKHQGGPSAFRAPKKELGQFFEVEKEYGNVFGTTFTGPNADQSRYVPGSNRQNELPFAQEKISHIDVKSEINRDIGVMYAERNNVDNTRTINNPKLSYEGKILGGKAHNDKRGHEGEVFKHLPDQDYLNTADKWLVTTGAIEAQAIYPEQVIKDTNRQYFNDGKLGPAAPVSFTPGEGRPMNKKSTNQQLDVDTNRNMALDNKSSNDDHNKDSYFAYPNERELTEDKTHVSNLKTVFEGGTEGPQDPMRRTIKQDTYVEDYKGIYSSDTLQLPTERLQDSVRPTVKETTNIEDHLGIVGSSLGVPTDRLQDKVRPTVKETTHFEYSGGAGYAVQGEMASDQYLRADTNPNKEIISQGRYPTPESTKLANGGDRVNIDIQKIESDYFNHYVQNADKVYQVSPQDHPEEYTQEKDTLDNDKLSDRLDPNMLDAFRTNPYTQSLASYAYT